MIKKVIYINYQPITARTINDYYLKELLDVGIVVEFWDLSQLYFPKTKFDTGLIPKLKVDVLQIGTMLSLESTIANQLREETLFILITTFEGKVSGLFELMTKYSCRTGFFARGALPQPAQNVVSYISKLKKVFNSQILIRYLRDRQAYLKKIQNKIKPYDFVFNAGNNGIQTVGLGYEIEKKRANVVNLNSFDFEKFSEIKDSERLVENKYCVFLDEYLPFHPDFEMLGIQTLDPEAYFDVLNNFFTAIEQKFHVEVVIAAHPKAERYKTENPFQYRRIFFNSSAELTKYSEFVLAHCTTSISFGVLYQKPILFLTSNLYESIMPVYHNWSAYFSQILASTFLNMDSYNLADINLNFIDEDKYLGYKYNYLTSKESEDKISSEIFVNKVLSL